MAILDQDRAKGAYTDVEAVAAKPESFRKKYATLVHKLPALLGTGGLCQAVSFIDSRGKTEGQLLLAHLARQLVRAAPAIAPNQANPGTEVADYAKGLVDNCQSAPLTTYLHLTNEARLTAAWYRRAVQAVLKLDAAAADAELGDE